MKKSKIIKNKFVSGVLVAGMLLTPGAMAFADSTQSDITSDNSKTKIMQRMQGDHAAAVMPGKGGEDHQGIISILDKLVAEGIISQADADSIEVYQQERSDERQAEMEKIKAMTAEERKVYFEENKSEMGKGSMMDKLVDEDIITQEQADEIKEYQDQVKKDEIKERMQTLVDEGILTDSDVENVIEYMEDMKEQQKEEMESNKDERQAEMEKIKAMTAEERKAYFEENKKDTEKTGMLEQMVEDGVITQEQADSLKDVIGFGKAAEKMRRPDVAEKTSSEQSEE